MVVICGAKGRVRGVFKVQVPIRCPIRRDRLSPTVPRRTGKQEPTGSRGTGPGGTHLNVSPVNLCRGLIVETIPTEDSTSPMASARMPADSFDRLVGKGTAMQGKYFDDFPCTVFQIYPLSATVRSDIDLSHSGQEVDAEKLACCRGDKHQEAFQEP